MAVRDIVGWKIIQDEDFDKEVLQHREQIVVVEFFREHCSSCDMFEDTLARIAQKYGSVLKLVRVNTGWENKWEDVYDVLGQPTTSFFFNGRWYKSHSGASGFDYYEDIFLYYLSEITKTNNLAPISKTMFDATPIRTGPTAINHLIPDQPIRYTHLQAKP